MWISPSKWFQQTIQIENLKESLNKAQSRLHKLEARIKILEEDTHITYFWVKPLGFHDSISLKEVVEALVKLSGKRINIHEPTGKHMTLDDIVKPTMP